MSKRPRDEAPAEEEGVDGTRPFSDFDISPRTQEALRRIGVTSLFPVQAMTFEAVSKGKDVLVQSRTGSGKTFAFGLPIVERLQKEPSTARGRGPAAVIFCPTRELAVQVCDVLKSIASKCVVTALYGGVAYATQERALNAGVDIVVATPGRAKDLLEKGTLRFNRTSIVVLDEADHMLDIGFKDDIEFLLHSIQEQRGDGDEKKFQTLLFSATVPDWVQSSSFISKDREYIDLVGKDTTRTAKTIRFYRRKCANSEIPSMLADLIRVYSGKHGRTLVFTNTKRDCHDLSINNTKLDSQCLHGDMQQDQRESTMKSFRENKFGVLIATDVAARGLDLPLVDLVIQCAPPSDIDSFIHRAGRTGRAGRKGCCVLLHQQRDEHVVDRIQRHAKITFEMLPSPSREEILQAVARDITEDLARVERRATELFREQSEALLKEADPVEILASALAVMSGYTSTIAHRGLLTGAEHFVTFKITSDGHMPIGAYCGMLREYLGDEIFARCRDISLLADEPGRVLDVPESFADEVAGTSIPSLTLERISVLPPIVTPDRGRGRGGFQGRGFDGGRRGFGGGGRYGRGDRGDSFGGGGGRRDSRYSGGDSRGGRYGGRSWDGGGSRSRRY